MGLANLLYVKITGKIFVTGSVSNGTNNDLVLLRFNP